MNLKKTFALIYQRWVAKSPKNARIATNVFAACTFIIGFPAFLHQAGVAVPHVVQPYMEACVAAAAAVLAIGFKLTKENEDGAGE